MKRLILITVILALFFLSLTPLSQERRVQVTAKEKRLALVIGNNNYSAGRLGNAVNDARSIKNILQDLGFSVIYSENADLRKMTSSVQELERKLRAGGVGLFYFSGHGIQIEGFNYLLPVGANVQSEADVKFECYPADRVIESMSNAKNRLNIVILDACRDNPFARSFSRSSSKGLAQMNSGKGMLIAYATSPGDTASDGPGMNNGLFTHHLLTSMKTTGFNLEQVFKNTREAVNNASNGKQLPWTSSSIIGEFVFLPISSSQPKAPTFEPKLPTSTKVDLSDIEAEAKKNREAKQQERKAWSDWQKEFQLQVNKAKQIENDEDVSAGSKKKAWERILNAYNEENPYSADDERLRKNARERIRFWEKKIIVINPATTFSGIHLRSDYRTLSEDEVGSMLRNKGFFFKGFMWRKKRGNPKGDFRNNYKLRTANGKKVVIDHATGLMWHQSGSSKHMKYEKIEQWIRDLNNRGYAGYHDWRLPTLEECASLLENSKQNGDLYIDPVFSSEQSYIWTGDVYIPGAAWVVLFDNAYVGWNSLITLCYFVRPVRSEITKPSYQPSTFSSTQLRSRYRKISLDKVKSMLKRKGFFDYFRNESGSFINNFQSRTISGDKVVIDRATSLMWHQSGSSGTMKFDKAKQWIRNLNSSGYAGYYDWRLPTLEEGASLLESSKSSNKVYIDSSFSDEQWWIWTGDKEGSGAAWVVSFYHGSVYYRNLDFIYISVRPVRSGQ